MGMTSKRCTICTTNLWLLLDVVGMGWSRVMVRVQQQRTGVRSPSNSRTRLLKKSKSSTAHVAAESVRATIGLQRYSLFADEGATSARRCMVAGVPHTSAGRGGGGIAECECRRRLARGCGTRKCRDKSKIAPSSMLKICEAPRIRAIGSSCRPVFIGITGRQSWVA